MPAHEGTPSVLINAHHVDRIPLKTAFEALLVLFFSGSVQPISNERG